MALLDAIDTAGLAEHFVVVGTHALYAYETAASVRIESAALATQDVDLLWDARRRVQFAHDLARGQSSMLALLQRVDPSFERKDVNADGSMSAGMTAINARGFEVDFLRREPEGDDPHPFRFSNDERDLTPVPARRAAFLTRVARVEVPVVCVTGRMALMRTVEPAAFVAFKRWLAADAPEREPGKRRRDARQAELVQALLDEGLLESLRPTPRSQRIGPHAASRAPEAPGAAAPPGLPEEPKADGRKRGRRPLR